MNASQKLNQKLGFQSEMQKISRSSQYCNQAKIFTEDAMHLQRGEWTVVAHGKRFFAPTLTSLVKKIDRYLKRNNLTSARMF